MFAASRSQCGRSLSKFRRAETLNTVGPSRGTQIFKLCRDKTCKRRRVLQCYCVTGVSLYDVTQIAKSLKTIVFYSVRWLLVSAIRSYILQPKYGLVLIKCLNMQRTSRTACRAGDGPCRGLAARTVRTFFRGGNQFA